jgi:hypothetical protein
MKIRPIDTSPTSRPQAYIVYFVCGLIGGGVFPADSFGQALSWQISAGGAVSANVLAGIWLARRGEDLSAAGFTMPGIAHGVFFAAIVMEHIDFKVGAAAAFLMIVVGSQVTAGAWQASCFIGSQALEVVWGGYFLKAARDSARPSHQPRHALNRSF